MNQGARGVTDLELYHETESASEDNVEDMVTTETRQMVIIMMEKGDITHQTREQLRL